MAPPALEKASFVVGGVGGDKLLYLLLLVDMIALDAIDTTPRRHLRVSQGGKKCGAVVPS
jgi:hypothetical protein